MKQLLLALALAWPLMAQVATTITACPPGNTTSGCKSVVVPILPVPTVISALNCPAIQLPATTTVCTVTLNQPVPSTMAGGFSVALTYDANATGPASLTIPVGASSGTFTTTATTAAINLLALGYTICAPLQPCWAYTQIAVPLS
jgi:hypothetical protein